MSNSMGRREPYSVALQLPWIVRGVEDEQEAIDITVSELDRLTSDTNTLNRNITVQPRPCPHCEGRFEDAFHSVDVALVDVVMTVEVEAASVAESKRIAKREIGRCLDGTPLKIHVVTALEKPEPSTHGD